MKPGQIGAEYYYFYISYDVSVASALPLIGYKIFLFFYLQKPAEVD